MSPNQQAVIFDWNGTLLSDTTLCLRATNESLALFGIAPVSLETYRREHRLPLDAMYAAFGCEAIELKQRRHELMTTWSAFYDRHVPTARLRRGAKDTLCHLKGRRHKVAILSNHIVEEIVTRTAQHAIDHHFDDILANAPHELYSIMDKKSKGGRLQAFIDEHDIKCAVVIGDTPEEVEIAHAHGYIGVALSDGVCSLSRLRAAKPDFLIKSLAELPAITQKIFG